MEQARYKRRVTQTRRQSPDEFTRAPLSASRIVAPIAHRSPSASVRSAPTHHPLDIESPRKRVRPADAQPVKKQVHPVQPVQTHTPIKNALPVEAPRPVSNAQKLPRITMGLPGDPSPQQQGSVRVLRSRWKTFRRLAFRSTAIVLVLIMGVGGLLFSQGFLKARKVFRGGTTSAASLKADVDPNLLKGEGDGRINVLLLGRGGGSHTAPDLTDTLLVASIDPVNHTSTLLSIPRDLWVTVQGKGSMKINAVWETGKYKHLGKIDSSNKNSQAVQAGFTLIDQTIEDIIGVPIHYNVLVDFQAFKQAVDTVGGVSFNVTEDLFDPSIAWENGNSPIIAKAGPQTFDGKRALLFVRSRQTSSDFARSQRQRQVLLALKDQVKNLGTLSNPAKISGLVSAFGDNIQTDLSLGDAGRLYGIFKNVDNAKIGSVGLADAPNSFVTTGNINGQSVVQPRAGLFNYSAIQNFVRGQLKDPYLLKEAAKIRVLNGTTQPGLATTQADLLKSYGYTVTETANAPTSGYAETVVVDLSHGKKYTKNYLEQRFGVTAVTKLPDTLILPGTADFVIIVGNDTTLTH